MKTHRNASLLSRPMTQPSLLRKTADYSVIQTWGIFHQVEEDEYGIEYVVPNLILLGNVKDRFEYPDLRRTAQHLYQKHKPDVCIIEKKASGQSLLQDMRLAGLPVLDYLPDRDKVSRVYAATPLMESGRVYIHEVRSGQRIYR
jgi:predicted phage terminase large subunit-like protein